MQTRILVYGLLVFGLLSGINPNAVYGQRTPTISERTANIEKINLKTATMPPFLIWTDLSQRDIQSILPRGATVTVDSGAKVGGLVSRSGSVQRNSVGRNKFVISGLTNLVQFAVDIGMKSTEKNAGIPGFGKIGAKAPKQISPQIQDLINRLGELIHDMIYAPPVPKPREPFPPGLVPDLFEIQKLLPGGFDRRKDPPPFGGGYWEYYCEPTDPCVRPAEPIPEDVDDCKDEQDEIDRLLAKYKYWQDALDLARKQLAFLQGLKLGDDAVDGAIGVLIIYAGVAGPVGSMAAVVPAAVAYVVKQIIDYNTLSAAIEIQERQIADLERIANSYRKGLNDAYAAWRACRKKAAETEQANSEAFQKFINVDLPAYYACLERRKCRRRWVPK